jgi:hypothetical protein
MFELIVTALATHQIVNVYRYSYYFQSFRAAREIGKPIPFLPKREGIQDWAAKLLACPWCLSVNVAIVLSIGCLLFYPVRVVAFALAASQIAGLIHHLTKHKGVKQT